MADPAAYVQLSAITTRQHFNLYHHSVPGATDTQSADSALNPLNHLSSHATCNLPCQSSPICIHSEYSSYNGLISSGTSVGRNKAPDLILPGCSATGAPSHIDRGYFDQGVAATIKAETHEYGNCIRQQQPYGQVPSFDSRITVKNETPGYGNCTRRPQYGQPPLPPFDAFYISNSFDSAR